MRGATWRVCLGAALLATALAVGCAVPLKAARFPRKPVVLGPIGESSPVAQAAQRVCAYDDSAWQQLLLKHVAPGWPEPPDPQGPPREPPWPELVAYREVLSHPGDLNAYLAVLSATGPAATPRAFPTAADRLAYWINAYNACAIRAALADYPSGTVYSPLAPAFETDWYFQVDGRRVNLAELRQQARVTAAGDVKYLFALCAASVGCPPLAPRPYKAAGLYDALDAQTRLCLSMPRFMAISHASRHLQLWRQIPDHRDAFDRWYENRFGSRPTSLLNVVLELVPPPQRQSLNKAVGYRIVKVPFDRRLNDLAVRAGAATASGQPWPPARPILEQGV